MANRDPRIDATLDLLKTGAKVARFFARANDPRWLEPSVERGLFRDPPKAIREGDSLRFVAWPQAEFLARVASRADPRAVLAAIREVEATDNVVVYPNLVKALLALPAEVVAEAVNRVQEWIDIPYSGRFFFNEVGELVVGLAHGGQPDGALALARSMLEIVNTRPAKEVEVEGGTVQIHQQPEGRLEPWEFDRFLQASAPTLIAQDPMSTATLLGGALDAALLAEFGERYRDEHRDVSYSWCREVEAAAEQPVHEYKQTLVPWLRDASVAAAHLGEGKVQEVVAMLRGYPWPIHTRIAMVVSAEMVNEASEVAKSLLLDRSLFDDLNYKHEYALLTRSAFALLDNEERETFLSWVDAGPSYDWTEDQKGRWRRDRLTFVRDALSEEWRRRYDDAVTKFGEPDWQADHLIGPMQFWTGPTSPMTGAELRVLSIDEVIDFLRNWDPPQAMHAPTREGLGRALAADVQTRPNEYAARADAFGELDPTYARSFISGLRAGLDNFTGVDLEPLLQFALRIVEARVKAPLRDGEQPWDLDEDRDWGGSRLEIGHLVEALASRNLVDAAHEATAARIVVALLGDADPTEENEARYGVGMGAVNYSINTVRGQAVHAAAALLTAMQRHEQAAGVADSLRNALRARLDPDVEKSIAVRAAFGMSFSRLVEAGTAEVAELGALTFTDDEAGRAAWSAFLRFHRLARATVDALWPILNRSLREAAWLADTDALSESLRLATALYVGGYSARDVLELTWSAWPNAALQTRASVVYALSQFVESVDLPDEVPVRIAQLVDGILDFEEEHRGPRTDEKRVDLEALGTILVSNQMSIDWTIATIDRLLALDSLIADLENVVQRLADAMDREDLQGGIVGCVAGIVRVDTQNWGVYAARQPIAAILRAGKASASARVREQAEALEGRLLAASRFNPDWLK